MRTFEGALTAGQYSFIAATSPEGWTSPWHVHHREDEGVYVISGLLRAKVGEGPFQHVRPGQFVFLPRKVPHCYRAVEETMIVVVCTPPGIEELFHEPAVNFDPESYSDEEFIKAAVALSARYGTEVLGPFPEE
jgi:quercetin dioxygenase-like cupin family protein